jgi:2-amino-4-hydroxy-6-hydroxymethyldihydropteridine diphosphokinase
MAITREFYLSLGSNIQPELHLADAVRLLQDFGEVRAISGVWESQAVGSEGPNFLNVSVRFHAEMNASHLKSNVVDPIERALGRRRSGDKNAPRTIDIDILLEDSRAVHTRLWKHPYVILPMAELLPQYAHPVTGRRLEDEAPLAAASIWIRRRPDVILSPA